MKELFLKLICKAWKVAGFIMAILRYPTLGMDGRMDGPGCGPTTAGRVKQGREEEGAEEEEAFRNTFSLRDITSAAARERRMPREGKKRGEGAFRAERERERGV